MDQRGRTGALLVVLLLVAMVPAVAPASAADAGTVADLQAQDIQADYDPITESTTITWRNVNSTDGLLNQELQGSTYRIYRHTAPIDAAVLSSLVPLGTRDACTATNILDCRGFDDWRSADSISPHPGHAFTIEATVGQNETAYYAVTTVHSNGTEIAQLLPDDSVTASGVVEVSAEVRTPYFVQANFDATTSRTRVTWINYNDLNDVLPETGADAFTIHVWRSAIRLTRANMLTFAATNTPVANLTAITSQYDYQVPPSTNVEVHYAVTYLRPGAAYNGSDYEDFRLLTNNAMSAPVLEKNVPPESVSTVSAAFVPDTVNGTGTTTISWGEITSETDERYRIYRSAATISDINANGVQHIGTVNEGTGTFEFDLQRGNLGFYNYCVVVEDLYGVYSTTVTSSQCANGVSEDTFGDWVAEPTDVEAEFIGNGVTRITWMDQLGAEGEYYNIWVSQYRTQGSQFAENVSLTWLASVPDGIMTYDVQLPEDTTRTSFYFVTSVARYGYAAGSSLVADDGTYQYTGLVQNSAGPISEDTISPDEPTISGHTMVGALGLLTMNWVNDDDERQETYTIWKHEGDPFASSGGQATSSSDALTGGWTQVVGGILDDGEIGDTFARQIQLPPDREQDVWYAITITDQYGNHESRIINGVNAVLVSEDTRAPQVAIEVQAKPDMTAVEEALKLGSYRIKLQFSEDLDTAPIVNLTSTGGADFTVGEAAATVKNLNTNDPELGPEYYYDFEITGNDEAGELVLIVRMSDQNDNQIQSRYQNWSIDGQSPSVSIYSPSPSTEGSKYLYGNRMTVEAGVSDDVGITLMEYRFTRNIGTTDSVSEGWRPFSSDEVEVLGDNRTLHVEFDRSSGNFDPGQHELRIRAFDAAGNLDESSVRFIVDYCYQNVEAELICSYEQSLEPIPVPEALEVGFTDPPYILVWALAGFNLIALIAAVIVVQSSLSSGSGTKKKDDDEDDMDWMSEFVGTTSQPDMDSITQTASPETKAQPDIPEDDEDDPFAVNTLQRKERRRRPSKEDEDDEEEPTFKPRGKGDDDDDDDEDDDEEEAPRRVVRRRPPARRVVKRS